MIIYLEVVVFLLKETRAFTKLMQHMDIQAYSSVTVKIPAKIFLAVDHYMILTCQNEYSNIHVYQIHKQTNILTYEGLRDGQATGK